VVGAVQESWGGPARRPLRGPEMRARRLAARWLIPVEGAPIKHGALLIGPDGRVGAMGPDSSVPRPSDVLAEEFGDAVILPGLINTHTHLELTGFAGQVGEREFPAWIRRLRQLKATRAPAEYVEAARRGLAACYAGGVTTIADTGDSGAAIQVLAEAGGSGLAYQEVFGPHPGQAEESLAGLRNRVTCLGRWAGNRVRLGVSPHAPYTVSGPLFRAVAAWSRAESLPLAVHIAESPAETEFLAHGSGPFAGAWEAREIPLPRPPGLSPVAWLDEHGVLAERTLCIHAVQLRQSDIDRLANSGAAVAHCPLSNRAHRHGVAPLAAMLRAGIRVGIGTDSEVSVGRLDLLAEARAARCLGRLTADAVIELCTLGGAGALDLASETGSLRIGKWGDCVVIRVTNAGEESSPAELVLASSPADVLLTCLGGRDVYRAL
jgi:cytosine/adenosine deaminase-related metal-dependent hydrolase